MKISSLSERTKTILGYEYDRAVRKHGATFASPRHGIAILIREVDEVIKAMRKGDIYGKHGVLNETGQVATVCFKLMETIAERRKTEKT